MKKILFLLMCFTATVIARAQEDLAPPPPPLPPKVAKNPVSPVVTMKGKQADEFYKRNPTVAGLSRQGNIVTIKLKDKGSEKYDRTNPDQATDFEHKYGECPIPPPPPPPPPKPKKES
jgi:hypothetical protein